MDIKYKKPLLVLSGQGTPTLPRSVCRDTSAAAPQSSAAPFPSAAPAPRLPPTVPSPRPPVPPSPCNSGAAVCQTSALVVRSYHWEVTVAFQGRPQPLPTAAWLLSEYLGGSVPGPVMAPLCLPARRVSIVKPAPVSFKLQDRLYLHFFT